MIHNSFFFSNFLFIKSLRHRRNIFDFVNMITRLLTTKKSKIIGTHTYVHNYIIISRIDLKKRKKAAWYNIYI